MSAAAQCFYLALDIGGVEQRLQTASRQRRRANAACRWPVAFKLNRLCQAMNQEKLERFGAK